MIQVALMDDQLLVRQGIRALLEIAGDIEVVFEAQDGEEGLQKLKDHPVQVVLLDVRMPRMNGVEVLRHLQSWPSPPAVLILTTFDDDEVVLEAVKLGARGFLLKDASLQQLLDAVRTVASGSQYVQPAVTDRILQALRNQGKGAEPERYGVEPLTERELEVLRLMAGGYSNKEIAGAKNLSEGTVKNHVSSILSKLGTRDRTRAVLKAIEHKLI
ncbi:response regulator [Deinococcus cellulosilyticus]|uniref:DNA-binding response regulator n=1 Tax=Deinococcus cellulosilyticus (strain DSM 18568 / NBRC 106333 / KACC 11606 / 5516J-15) TaxID=1223518 RepID=A0A511N4Y1_DEIC1|nr:response regulator transcription factor [Deinococcus cellulosilyticus]GEM47506.1 DNA-binding response regulator [Deinococcus cellulosilyticus NBRC 106333 = KACC 11606]